MQNKIKNSKDRRLGIVALATIILISAIILEIGLVTAFIVYTLNNVNYGSRLSGEALLAAKSGIDDVFLRLSRNKDFFSYYPLTYSIAVGSRTAYISATIISSGVQIVSEGVAFNKHRKLQVIFDVDPTTGIVKIVSQKELGF